MNSVERVKTLCKERKIPISKLEKDLGFSNGYIGQLRKGTFPSDRLALIAEYLGVSAGYLITGIENSCPQCNFHFYSYNNEEIMAHNKEHASWEKANRKFGPLYCNTAENERLKAQGRNNSQNLSLPLAERYDAQLLVLRCLFSRSIENSGYNLNHVDFNNYVSMMLNSPKYRARLDDELCQKLINDYGTMPGIRDGESIYYVPASPYNKELSLSPKILTYYDQLNVLGQEIATEQVRLLTLDKKYTDQNVRRIHPSVSEPDANYLLANAAHDRTDTAFTEEDRKADDDMLD